MSNVIRFPTVNHDIEEDDGNPEIGARALRKAYADTLANELFGQVMRTIESSGTLDALLEADDPAFEALYPRLIALKEVLLSIYYFMEGVEHELDPVVNTLYDYVSMDEESVEMLAQYNTKYLQRLIEVTREFNNETQLNND